MKFSKLGLKEEISKVLFENSYINPTTIQERVIPLVLEKKDIIARAQTGSGKSNLTAKLLREDENYIFVDSDKYKHFRYDAKDIANEYQVLYPFLTGPDGYDHADNIYEYAIANKYNIIKCNCESCRIKKYDCGGRCMIL